MLQIILHFEMQETRQKWPQSCFLILNSPFVLQTSQFKKDVPGSKLKLPQRPHCLFLHLLLIKIKDIKISKSIYFDN